MNIAERKKNVEARHQQHVAQVQAHQIEIYRLEGEYRLLEEFEREIIQTPPDVAPVAPSLAKQPPITPAQMLTLVKDLVEPTAEASSAQERALAQARANMPALVDDQTEWRGPWTVEPKFGSQDQEPLNIQERFPLMFPKEEDNPVTEEEQLVSDALWEEMEYGREHA